MREENENGICERELEAWMTEAAGRAEMVATVLLQNILDVCGFSLELPVAIAAAAWNVVVIVREEVDGAREVATNSSSNSSRTWSSRGVAAAAAGEGMLSLVSLPAKKVMFPRMVLARWRAEQVYRGMTNKQVRMGAHGRRGGIIRRATVILVIGDWSSWVLQNSDSIQRGDVYAI